MGLVAALAVGAGVRRGRGVVNTSPNDVEPKRGLCRGVMCPSQIGPKSQRIVAPGGERRRSDPRDPAMPWSAYASPHLPRSQWAAHLLRPRCFGVGVDDPAPLLPPQAR